MLKEAKRVQQAKALDKRHQFTTAWLFTVEGEPGLWRQIKRDGRQGIRTPVKGAVVAYVGDKLIELVRWTELESLLSERASLEVVTKIDEPEPKAVG